MGLRFVKRFVVSVARGCGATTTTTRVEVFRKQTVQCLCLRTKMHFPLLPLPNRGELQIAAETKRRNVRSMLVARLALTGGELPDAKST